MKNQGIRVRQTDSRAVRQKKESGAIAMAWGSEKMVPGITLPGKPKKKIRKTWFSKGVSLCFGMLYNAENGHPCQPKPVGCKMQTTQRHRKSGGSVKSFIGEGRGRSKREGVKTIIMYSMQLNCSNF